MNAQRATDTDCLVDSGYDPWPLLATRWVQRPRFAIEFRRERGYGRLATRRATVQIDQPGVQCYGVFATAGVSASGALGLRQQRINAIGRTLGNGGFGAG
jgi:hypothetical protein